MIRVDINELRSAAAKVRSLRDTCSRLESNLGKQNGVLTGAWQGQDELAFAQKLKSTCSRIQQTVSFLDRYADVLTKCADAYQNAQDRVISMARGL